MLKTQINWWESSYGFDLCARSCVEQVHDVILAMSLTVCLRYWFLPRNILIIVSNCCDIGFFLHRHQRKSNGSLPSKHSVRLEMKKPFLFYFSSVQGWFLYTDVLDISSCFIFWSRMRSRCSFTKTHQGKCSFNGVVSYVPLAADMSRQAGRDSTRQSHSGRYIATKGTERMGLANSVLIWGAAGHSARWIPSSGSCCTSCLICTC